MARFINCDFCKRKAIVNFQKTWKKFAIDKDGWYKEDKEFCGADIEEPIDEENVHLCKIHSEKWLMAEI